MCLVRRGSPQNTDIDSRRAARAMRWRRSLRKRVEPCRPLAEFPAVTPIPPARLISDRILLLPALVHGGVIGQQPFTVGSGIDCATGNVQFALDATAATPGPANYPHRAQPQLHGAGIDRPGTDRVTLTDGYDHCSDATADSYTALMGNDVAPMVTFSGSGNVSLVRLEISRGRGPSGQGPSIGGSVMHRGCGALSTASSSIHDNSAQFGSRNAAVGNGSLTLSSSSVSVREALRRGRPTSSPMGWKERPEAFCDVAELIVLRLANRIRSPTATTGTRNERR